MMLGHWVDLLKVIPSRNELYTHDVRGWGVENGVGCNSCYHSLFPPKKMQSSAQLLSNGCFDFWRNLAFHVDDNYLQRLGIVERPQTADLDKLGKLEQM